MFHKCVVDLGMQRMCCSLNNQSWRAQLQMQSRRSVRCLPDLSPQGSLTWSIPIWYQVELVDAVATSCDDGVNALTPSRPPVPASWAMNRPHILNAAAYEYMSVFFLLLNRESSPFMPGPSWLRPRCNEACWDCQCWRWLKIYMLFSEDIWHWQSSTAYVPFIQSGSVL